MATRNLPWLLPSNLAGSRKNLSLAELLGANHQSNAAAIANQIQRLVIARELLKA